MIDCPGDKCANGNDAKNISANSCYSDVKLVGPPPGGCAESCCGKVGNGAFEESLDAYSTTSCGKQCEQDIAKSSKPVVRALAARKGNLSALKNLALMPAALLH